MIRFFDKEIGCAEYESLTGMKMLEDFFSKGKDNILCVYDDFNTMEYRGIITWDSYRRAINVSDAIMPEYVILSPEMWQDARQYFAYRNGQYKTEFPLPVFNQDGELECFAYEDADANREIRMLRELQENPTALQFSDIYSEYKCVRIYGFNELAYFFAKYLESQGIAVEVNGSMWEGVFNGNECAVPDYECMEIYAEGIGSKKRTWRENLLRSVSVEFECIDKIYEENIRKGIIKDTKGSCADLIERLKGENEVIILRTGMREQAAYDFLLGQGVDICCFVNTKADEPCHRIFGKKMVRKAEAMRTYANPVFIECAEKGSAWGLGEVDYYDYRGYRRNESYILLRDYLEAGKNGLLNILCKAKIVLAGDSYLCQRLYEYLGEKGVVTIKYLSGPWNRDNSSDLPECHVEDIDEEAMCLLVEPVYYKMSTEKWEGRLNEWIKYIEEKQIDNYTIYFSDMSSFTYVESDYKNDKYTKEYLTPKRIVLGAIGSCSGNLFFQGLVDGHPSILIMEDCYLSMNLFWICVCLSMKETKDILPFLWKLIDNNCGAIFNPTAFNEKMNELLACGKRFTSQELFVMIHIAYMHMWGRNIVGNDIGDKIIYWNPHYMARDTLEKCAEWLGAEKMPCDIFNIARNLCMWLGSTIKVYLLSRAEFDVYDAALCYVGIDKKDYKYSNRVTVRFEDLKCNPRETLKIICEKWEIPWSDTLMHTTHNGEKSSWYNGEQEISDFDLAPVYNLYEKFFSEFDRFRMMLINAPYQRKYGYPYVEITQFSRRELQEMFLKSFRFEELPEIEIKDKNELNQKMRLQRKIKNRLQNAKRDELLWEERRLR